MTPRAPFPTDLDQFDDDPRISYSQVSRTHLLEDENGEEWEWLADLSKWTKTMDENEIKRQAEIYKVAGVDEEAPAFNPAQKRKEAQLEDPAINPKNAKTRPNTAVFVTGLPQDVDQEEVRSFFSKYGMIAESVDDDGKRVKLYNDKHGNFKGEALIIYHRPESIGIAIEMADGAIFPRFDFDASAGPITVTAADSSFKAHKDDTVAEDRPKAKANSSSRAKAKKKAVEMNSRLADWSDDEPSALPQTSSRWDKVVIIKRVFTLQELEDEPEYLEDAKADMQEGAEPYGDIKNITIFDREEDGVVTIRFSNAVAAKACAKAFNGRGYNGRPLEAYIATGNEKFKKSFKARTDETDEEQKRLDAYSDFIEGKGADVADATNAANGDSHS